MSFWSSCLHFLSARITGVSHYAWFFCAAKDQTQDSMYLFSKDPLAKGDRYATLHPIHFIAQEGVLPAVGIE